MSSTDAGTPKFGQRETQPTQPIVPKTASEALRPEAGTPPPNRSRASRSQIVVFMNFVVSSVMLLVLGAGLATYIGKAEFDGPGPSRQASNFVVVPGADVGAIAEQLERRGLISDARIFKLGVRAYGNDTAVQAGEYEVKAAASMRDIMELLKSGASVEYSLTIPEGITVDQAFERLASHEALTGDVPEKPPEGSIATDTQRFTRGSTRAQILDRLVTAQTRLVEGIWNRRAPDLPIADVNEFVTLASIVEKETGRGDERSRVAAVFINRLNKGMRLQSDPTIIYGLFGGKGKPSDRPIYKSDIDRKTPYNTYQINGLPPGPIANPGRAALEAVANPSKTDDLYFVADGTGGHVFARTLDEHNENVARYRAYLAKQAQDAGKAPDAAKAGVADDAPAP